MPEEQQHRHTAPPKELLEAYKVSGEEPRPLYCPRCTSENNCHRFLLLLYGGTGFYFHYKGKNKFTGEPRGYWIVTRDAVMCEHGHTTVWNAEGKVRYLRQVL